MVSLCFLPQINDRSSRSAQKSTVKANITFDILKVPRSKAERYSPNAVWSSLVAELFIRPSLTHSHNARKSYPKEKKIAASSSSAIKRAKQMLTLIARNIVMV